MQVKHMKDMQLDYAAANACGFTVIKCGAGEHAYLATVDEEGKQDKRWMPTRNWKQGGRILEEYGIDVYCMSTASERVEAEWLAELTGTPFKCKGITPLEAILRCFVTYRVGYSMLIPEGI